METEESKEIYARKLRNRIEMNFLVVCINAKKRPADFPVDKWLVEEEIYTVVERLEMVRQNMTIGYVLKEIDLSSVKNYKAFHSKRFRLATKVDLELHNLRAEVIEEQNQIPEFV